MNMDEIVRVLEKNESYYTSAPVSPRKKSIWSNLWTWLRGGQANVDASIISALNDLKKEAEKDLVDRGWNLTIKNCGQFLKTEAIVASILNSQSKSSVLNGQSKSSVLNGQNISPALKTSLYSTLDVLSDRRLKIGTIVNEHAEYAKLLEEGLAKFERSQTPALAAGALAFEHSINENKKLCHAGDLHVPGKILAKAKEIYDKAINDWLEGVKNLSAEEVAPGAEGLKNLIRLKQELFEALSKFAPSAEMTKQILEKQEELVAHCEKQMALFEAQFVQMPSVEKEIVNTAQHAAIILYQIQLQQLGKQMMPLILDYRSLKDGTHYAHLLKAIKTRLDLLKEKLHHYEIEKQMQKLVRVEQKWSAIKALLPNEITVDTVFEHVNNLDSTRGGKQAFIRVKNMPKHATDKDILVVNECLTQTKKSIALKREEYITELKKFIEYLNQNPPSDTKKKEIREQLEGLKVEQQFLRSLWFP